MEPSVDEVVVEVNVKSVKLAGLNGGGSSQVNKVYFEMKMIISITINSNKALIFLVI